MRTLPALFCLLFWTNIPLSAQQHSVARLWNEQLLQAIRTDLARPTVHARNLFHIAVAMYDGWAIYQPDAETYLLGKTVHGFNCPYHPVPPPADRKAAQEETISFAVYRIMQHRFANSPGAETLFPKLNRLMDSLGYNRSISSTNYKCGPAEMGNYIAKCILEYGLQDGSNEADGYANLYYKPVNPPMRMEVPGNPNILDLNRWQPLEFVQFVDQSGNPFNNIVTTFLSPEWGNVLPFSLQPEDATVYQRDGHTYTVYHDPGPPPYLDTTAVGGVSEEYKWGHALVAVWSSLLDPSDGVLIDISPAGMGNNSVYPTDIPGLRDFFNLYYGGDDSPGRPLNPKTGQPYAPQIVPRGDFTRAIAEFWADGPSSETPPGHWFTLLNYVNDQAGLVKKIRGAGPLCTDLEWDVKSYFALGGAMHDVAITAWGIKGWYDSARPVSAIRGMAALGQSTDPGLPHYHPGGLPLLPGYIELIQAGDSLEGSTGQYIGEIKLKAWRGPDYIKNPKSDEAGVGWIRAANWWPYQRPTFVTPPFAGYISGHSTYSRAAAELLTALTGDAYFPGGLGSYFCPKNEFLVFEEGPSTGFNLQWATYRDASDQCSLSRIYGGIHPPADDIPGRLIGEKIGLEALAFAEQYFTKTTPPYTASEFKLFPNPTTCVVQIEYPIEGSMPIQVLHIDGRLAFDTRLTFSNHQAILDLDALGSGVYVVAGLDEQGKVLFQEKVVRL